MNELEPLIGNWSSIIGDEFYKPYMMDIAKQVEKSKASLFDSFYPGRTDQEMFKIFKDTDVTKLKLIYIVDSPGFDIQPILNNMEKVFGLNLGLVTSDNLNWLREQGVMFFPRHLTYGDIGVHDYWTLFTDNVLVKILSWNSDIILMTDSVTTTMMIEEMNPLITILSCSNWEYINNKTDIKLDERDYSKP